MKSLYLFLLSLFLAVFGTIETTMHYVRIEFWPAALLMGVTTVGYVVLTCLVLCYIHDHKRYTGGDRSKTND